MRMWMRICMNLETHLCSSTWISPFFFPFSISPVLSLVIHNQKPNTHTHRIEWSDAIMSAYMFYRCTHNAWLLPLPLLLLLLVIVTVKLLAAFSGYKCVQVAHMQHENSNIQTEKKTQKTFQSISLSLSFCFWPCLWLSPTRIKFADYICYNRLCALMFI